MKNKSLQNTYRLTSTHRYRNGYPTQGWWFFILLFVSIFPTIRTQSVSSSRFFRSYGVDDNVTISDMIMMDAGPLFVGARTVAGRSRALVVQTDMNGAVSWTTQWDQSLLEFGLTNVVKLKNTTLLVAGYVRSTVGDNRAYSYEGRFDLTSKTSSYESGYTTVKGLDQDKRAYVCKNAATLEGYCFGTLTDDKVLIGERTAFVENGTPGSATALRWQQQYKLKSGAMIKFQDFSWQTSGSNMVIIGTTTTPNSTATEHFILQINKNTGDFVKMFRSTIGGTAKGGRIAYKADGQSFVAAFTTDSLSAIGDDTLIYEMSNDLTTLSWTRLLKQPGDNTLTQMKIGTNNRLLLSGYVRNHPMQSNELAAFIMINPDQTLNWAHYFTSATHTRGQAIDFGQDGNAIYFGGYGVDANNNRSSIFAGKIGVDDNVQISNCSEYMLALPTIAIVNLKTALLNMNVTDLMISGVFLTGGTPISPTESALNISMTPACVPGNTNSLSTAMSASLTASAGTATLQSMGSTGTGAGTGTGMGTGTGVTTNSGQTIMASDSTAATPSTPNTLSSLSTQSINTMVSNTNDTTTTANKENLMGEPSVSPKATDDNSVLYIIIGVLGGLLISVLAGVGISRLIKGKRQDPRNASPESPKIATAIDDEMQSARVSQRYDNNNNQDGKVLQSKSSAAFSGRSTQYDTPPPPPHSQTGTLSILTSLEKSADAKGTVTHNTSDYQAVPPPRNAGEDDYAELELRSPTVVITQEQQNMSQYTAAPKTAKHASKTAAASQKNGIKQNVYDKIVQQEAAAAQGYDDVPQGTPAAQGYDDVPHASKDSKNRLPKNPQYDNTDVPLESSTVKLPTLTQRARKQNELIEQDDAEKGLAAGHYKKVGVFGTEGTQQRRKGHAGPAAATANGDAGASADVASSSNATRANYDVVPALALSVKN